MAGQRLPASNSQLPLPLLLLPKTKLGITDKEKPSSLYNLRVSVLENAYIVDTIGGWCTLKRSIVYEWCQFQPL